MLPLSFITLCLYPPHPLLSIIPLVVTLEKVLVLDREDLHLLLACSSAVFVIVVLPILHILATASASIPAPRP